MHLHYSVDNSYLFVNGKEICKFKADDKNVKINVKNKHDYVESEEVSLKENFYNFSVDYDAINKSDILIIYKYLMVKNNIKQCWSLIKKCLLDDLAVIEQ